MFVAMVAKLLYLVLGNTLHVACFIKLFRFQTEQNKCSATEASNRVKIQICQQRMCNICFQHSDVNGTKEREGSNLQ